MILSVLIFIKYVFIIVCGWINVYIWSIGCFKDKFRCVVGSMVVNLWGLKYVVRDCVW